METKNLLKAGILVLIIVTIFIISWEVYWRSKGFPISYNDDEALWSEQRGRIYHSKEDATVFVGSSRIKFDLDIPTWEKITGEKAVQLSMVGTNPRPLLKDLANDERFKGKLIIDITEPLFFSPNPAREKSANDGIEFYKTYSPSQKASSFLSCALESNLVFLEKERFGLNALLKDLEIPNRPQVKERPVFVKEFGLNHISRQSFMTDKFLADTNLQNRQTAAWTKTGAMSKTPGVGGDTLIRIFKQVKEYVDKIRLRGGQVIFVRTPSSGAYWANEQIAFPRAKYWDAILAYTNSPGIHFKDYPETASFICPEWSHLSTADAIIYTKNLYRILQQKGWTFRNTKSIARY